MTPETFEEYKEFVNSLKSINYSTIQERLHNQIDLLHALIGINTENGELQDQFKKFLFYGKDLDLVNLKEELGDLLWYIQLACNFLDISIADCINSNMSKLKKRYPEGRVTNSRALNRNLVVERQELER